MAWAGDAIIQQRARRTRVFINTARTQREEDLFAGDAILYTSLL